MIPEEQACVDEIPAKRGVIVMQRLKHSIHLGFAVLPARGEPLRDVRKYRVPPLA